jgi:hypothetical protein
MLHAGIHRIHRQDLTSPLAFPSLVFFTTRHNRSFYDQEGKGYLREADLETYVYDLITTVPALQVRFGSLLTKQIRWC